MKLKLVIFSLLAILVASCTREPLPESGESEKGVGEIVTISVIISPETRVAYDDANLALSWQEGDQLRLAGYDGVTYKGSEVFTYSGTGNKFTGTPVGGATTYKAYYPGNLITLDANGNVNPLAADFWKQTQNGNGTTSHLSNKLFLSDEQANGLDQNFELILRNDIIKFDLSNLTTGPNGLGSLEKIIWTVEHTLGETRSAILNITGVSDVANLTAYLAFDPAVMMIAAGGKVTITLIGDQSYEWSKTINNAVTYTAGKRYTANVSGVWTAVKVEFSYSISTTQAGQTHEVWQKENSSFSPARLTIDWGDGTAKTIINQGQQLAKTIASHTYADPNNYIITITSNQAHHLLIKMPQITFYDGSSGDPLLTSVITPFPDMGATDFKYTFRDCRKLLTIPEDLFRYNIRATVFEGTFSMCDRLTAIPPGLFRYNTEIVNFTGCFLNCKTLTSIPANLFRYNTKTRGFDYCFRFCDNIQSIPTDLFRYNAEVGGFFACFDGLIKITTIPADLFRYNKKVLRFGYCFRNCKALTTIPTDLFSYNTNARSFRNSFEGCIKLELNPAIFPDPTANPDFFAGRVMEFDYCFTNAGSQAANPGTAPKLWLFTGGGGATGPTNWVITDCFKGVNVTNYNDIPNHWKGI